MSQTHKECIVCGGASQTPWSDLFRDEFEIPDETVICSEQCYHEGKAADKAGEAEYKADWLADR